MAVKDPPAGVLRDVKQTLWEVEKFFQQGTDKGAEILAMEISKDMGYVKTLAANIYKHSLKMALDAGNIGSHIGGSLSSVEIFASLYGYAMRYDAKDPLWDGRDRLIVSKAHCILSHFSALSLSGFFDVSSLNSFLEDGGLLCGHPYRPEIGLEFSGGSLGMGISVAVGMALSAKIDHKDYRVYALLGDGECNEGAVWEGFLAANKYQLDNLTVIIDDNNMQFDGPGANIMPLDPLRDKLSAFGFYVLEVDGHDVAALCGAFDRQGQAGKPTAMIAHTVKCRGVERLENKAESHHTAITIDDFNKAMERLMEDQ